MWAGCESADVDQSVAGGGWAALVSTGAGGWGGEGVDCHGEGGHFDGAEGRVGAREGKDVVARENPVIQVLLESYMPINRVWLRACKSLTW